MSAARSNGTGPQQVLDVGGNGDKPWTVSAQEVFVAPEGEELKARQRKGDGLGPRQETRPAAEDAEPLRERRRHALMQDRAIGLLVQGKTVTDVAQEVGVDRSTIHRWLNDSDLRLKLEARREELIGGMLDQQLLAARMATVKLMELLESSDEGVVLRAAIALYGGGQRAYNFMDLRKRIERVESNLQMYYGWGV